jgi:hypothetical protein
LALRQQVLLALVLLLVLRLLEQPWLEQLLQPWWSQELQLGCSHW